MLTEQRKRFVLEYIKLRCKNQREAAIRAGYSPKSAATQACDILKDSEVQAFLQEQKAAILREIQEDLALSASDAVSVVMMDTEAKDTDRLKAAFDILDRAGFRPEDRDRADQSAEELPKLLDALQEG